MWAARALRSRSTLLCVTRHRSASIASICRYKSSLVSAFDDWRPPSSRSSVVSTGLFNLDCLKTADGFLENTEAGIIEGDELFEKILAVEPGNVRMLELVDDLSDLLCRVADAATCIRQLHPDARYRDKSTESFQLLAQYMGKLNMDLNLYNHLTTLDTPEASKELDEQSLRTLKSLLADFHLSGIHLPPSKQEKVLELGENIQTLELMFEHRQSTIGGEVELNTNAQNGVKAKIDPFNVNSFLASFPDADQRQKLYEIAHNCTEEHDQVLCQLLLHRNYLAKLVGYDSFAQRQMKNNMLTDSEQVMTFLEGVRTRLGPKLEAEMQKLHAAKISIGEENNQLPSHEEGIRVCDKPYFAQHVQHHDSSLIEDSQFYFSLGNCMEGVNVVTQNIFGISLVVVEPAAGEVWHEDVKKLEIVHETEGTLGIMYCDLFERRDKTTGAAHYTIQTGREVRDSEGKFEYYQNPIVALTCSFHPRTSNPSFLSYDQLETLFHEIGHAFHSMFGRTKFQTVAGTRGPLDFVELPSHLMEHFMRDYRVVSQFAKHFETGEVIPERKFLAAQKKRNLFHGLALIDTLVQSTCDQLFHSETPFALKPTTTEILLHVQSQINPLTHATAPIQYRYGHLVGYATGYYSYLWCQALSSMIWHQCFLKDPLSRDAGDRYRKYVLSPASGRDPWNIIEDLLGYRPGVTEIANFLPLK
eukprot:m.182525 g.182525  ORF g.182525 m.182525 type:complete len:700 (+) comp32119_c9_seq1:308-2407(+)